MKSLSEFPVDDFTLDQLEHALNTCIGDDGEPVGGEFTLSRFLEFMSGYDPERKTLLGYTDDGIPIYEHWDAQYTERCVIRALINEVRKLRNGEA